MRDLINIISEICSILSFILSIFIASKIIKNSNSNNNNKGEFLQGDGTQTVVKDHSATGHASVTHNEIKDSIVYGEIDSKPTLTQNTYPICTSGIVKYRQNISDLSSEIVAATSTTLILSTNFVECDLDDKHVGFIGYCIKSLPFKDWRSFIEKNYNFSFEYEKTGTINEFQIEFKNCSLNKKIFETKVIPSSQKQKFTLDLHYFSNLIDDWKSVDEICIVFFLDKSKGLYGTVSLTDLKISTN